MASSRTRWATLTRATGPPANHLLSRADRVCPVVSSDDRQRYGVGLGEVEACRARPGAHFVPADLAGSRRDVVWPRVRAPGQSNGLHDDFPGARGALDGELVENVVGKARNCLAPVRLARPEDGVGDLLHADRADRIVEQRPLRPDSPLRRAETRAAIGVRSGHRAILASGAFCIWTARRRACPGPRGHGCGTASLYQYCGTVVLY